jgi:hypothetical protein
MFHVTLHGKRGFADVIKDPEMEKTPMDYLGGSMSSESPGKSEAAGSESEKVM